MEIEDFKYTFEQGLMSMAFSDDIWNFAYGYLMLHQFVTGDFFIEKNSKLIKIIESTLDDDETVEENNNIFTLTLNYVDDTIVEYTKFFLKCNLIMYKDFTVNGNIITFKRIFDESYSD